MNKDMLELLICDWLAFAKEDKLADAKLNPIYFRQSDSENQELALGLIKYVIEKMGMSPEEAMMHVNADFLSRFGLKSCYKAITFPDEVKGVGESAYIVQQIYPKRINECSKKALWILEYNKAFSKRKSLAKKDFLGIDGYDKARLLFNHYLSTHYGKWSKSVETAYDFFAGKSGEDIVKNAKLTNACNLFFESPLEYFHESVGPNKKDDFYYEYCQWKLSESEELIYG